MSHISFLSIPTTEEFMFHFSEGQRALLSFIWWATRFSKKHDKDEVWAMGMCFFYEATKSAMVDRPR